MSIEFYEQQCPGANGEPSAGDRFTPADVGKGKFAAAKRKGQWELIPTIGDYGWQIGGSRFNKPAWISWIHATSTAEQLVVVYADTGGKSDSAVQWTRVDGAAKSYAYAEQLPVGQPLKNWPNSQYQLAPGNNSNTFIHSMAAAIGASAAVFSDTPGAVTPIPNPNTDPAPAPIGGIYIWP